MFRSTSLGRLRETAYTIPKGTVKITLTCGHTALYTRPAPAPGTDAFCRDCGTWRRRKRTDKNRPSRARAARPAPGGPLSAPSGRRPGRCRR